MNSVKRMLPYIGVIAISFYVLPLIISNTGIAILTLLAIVPLTCLLTSIIYGKKEKFSFIYSIIIALLFIPTIFIFYNETALIYIIIYSGISLIGNFIGSRLKN